MGVLVFGATVTAYWCCCSGCFLGPVLLFVAAFRDDLSTKHLNIKPFLGLSLSPHNPGSVEHCLKWKETTSGDIPIFHCFPMTGGRFRPSLLHHRVPSRRWLQSLRKPQDQSLQQPCNSNRCILHPRKTTKHGAVFSVSPFFFLVGCLQNDGCSDFGKKCGRKHFCGQISWDDRYIYIYFDVFFLPGSWQFLSRPKWMPMRRRLPTILMQDLADRMSQLPQGFNQSTRWCFKTWFSPQKPWEITQFNWTHILKWAGSTTNWTTAFRRMVQGVVVANKPSHLTENVSSEECAPDSAV